jgi:hypothetical protein
MVRLDVRVLRRRCLRPVLQQERHLLREPAADDGVVPVEAPALRLAVEDLPAHRLVDKAIELPAGRRPSPLRRPPLADGPDLLVGHRDDAPRPGLVQPSVDGEHARPEQEEHYERRSSQSRGHAIPKVSNPVHVDSAFSRPGGGKERREARGPGGSISNVD